MNLGWKILLWAALAGIISIGSVILVYAIFGGFNGPLSEVHARWGEFGSFFGGVVGPIMAFASVVLIALTIGQQGLHLEEVVRDSMRKPQWDHLTLLHEQVDRVLDRKWIANNKHWNLREMVEGYEHGYREFTDHQYILGRRRLLRLLASYVDALKVYKENYGAVGGIKYHDNLVQEILKWFNAHQDGLDQLQLMTLGMIDSILNGKQTAQS